MAISFVGSVLSAGAGNGGNASIAFSGLLDAAGAAATMQQDDLVIIGHALSNTSDIAMAMGSAGWTAILQSFANGSTYDTNIAGWHKFMGASPDTTATCNGGGGAAFATAAGAIVFRGVDKTTPLDITPVHNPVTGTSRPNPASITPATAGAWPVVIGAGSAQTGAAFTVPAGLSNLTNHFRSINLAETNDIALGMGFKTDWASGAFDCPEFGGGSVNAANSSNAIAFALRPAGAAPTGGKVKIWTGSAWEEKPVKVWDGSAWVEKPLKVWDGGAWVLA